MKVCLITELKIAVSSVPQLEFRIAYISIYFFLRSLTVIYTGFYLSDGARSLPCAIQFNSTCKNAQASKLAKMTGINQPEVL